MLNQGELREKVLPVPQSNVRESDIDAVKRLAPPRHASKIYYEVLVVFHDVETWDMVRSFAPNLAAWRCKAENIEASIRMEVPTNLIGTCKTKYDAALKATHGKGFKRSICFDDCNMSLSMNKTVSPAVALEKKLVTGKVRP